MAVTWEFEPYEGLTELWPQDSLQQYLRDPVWSRQTRTKYANKRSVTVRGGAIRCNETVEATVTADTFKCSENHQSAAQCNFKCIPQTCVTQQMLERVYGSFYRG